MSFLKAKQLFEQKNYNEALQEYLRLEEIFGHAVVKANIKNCKEKIREYPCNHNKIDITTQILLDNENRKLSEERRQSLLKQLSFIHKEVSEEAKIRSVNPVPETWPADLKLFPLPDSTNDYDWYKSYKKINKVEKEYFKTGLSIIIPTYNRSSILKITLISLLNQMTEYEFEVIVADDGSSEDIITVVKSFESTLDIKYVRQEDKGYRLCEIRNLGLNIAKYDFLAILDCDMAANKNWVESYVNALVHSSDIAYIGPRKYIDTNHLQSDLVLKDPDIFEKIPLAKSDSISTSSEGGASIDWRLLHFKETDNLRLCNTPFRFFSGGNVAFNRKWLNIAGFFDEEFTHWGGEDNEFGYRLYKMGCFFKALDGALAYHQEPPGKENETDRSEGQVITRKIIEQKVPYFYRKLEQISQANIKKTPLVSIYVPAYNCQNSIVRCIESALNQTITDLEVVVCNDGSTDKTWEVLKDNYYSHPRVRIFNQENSGIAGASNKAVKNCKGFYIGQLDSDDYLQPDAVSICLQEFLKDKNLACVYTTYRNMDEQGNLINYGYNWPVYSREMLATSMIAHHFRMFTIRAWNLTTGFNENIENAVDYDMYLKLSEIGTFKHVNRICYNRVLHDNNTSIKKLGIQKQNHYRVVNMFFKRQGVNKYNYLPLDQDDKSRGYKFERVKVD